MSDWNKLSEEQRKVIADLRKRMGQQLLSEIDSFHEKHPQLQIGCRLHIEPLIYKDADILARNENKI